MAFLTLSGLTVDVAKGGEHSEMTSGWTDGYVYGNEPARDPRNIRRKWVFETIQVDDITGEGLIGWISGRGQSFPYTSNLYSSGNLAPSGTSVATIVPGKDLQTDPALVYLESSGEQEAMFWGGALEMGPATINLLDADQRDCEGSGTPPNGFTAYNSATVVAETTIRLQGNQSVKCTTSGTANSGVQATGVTVSGISTYTASVYVYAASAHALTIVITDDGGSWTATNFDCTAGAWVRVVHTHTSYSGSTSLGVQIRNQDSTSGKVYYCDMWQLEEKSYATPWYDGTRSAEELLYRGITNLSNNLTFACWTRPPTTNSGANAAYLLVVYDSAVDDYVTILRDASTNNIKVQLVSSDSGGSSTLSDTSVWDDGWHHVCLVLAARVGGTDRCAYLYLDGSLIASSTNESNYPKLRNNCDYCKIGNTTLDNYAWEGPIQDALVLPFAMSATQVAALAARTSRSAALFPKLDAQGTFNSSSIDGDTRDHNFEVRGKVTGVDYDGAVHSGTHQSQSRRIKFELESDDLI